MGERVDITTNSAQEIKMEEGSGEIKQVSEREIRVGTNRICLGEDNIVRLTIDGEIDVKNLNEIIEVTFKLSTMVEGKANVLIDLNKCGKISSKARKKQKEISELDKWGNTALFGIHLS